MKTTSRKGRGASATVWLVAFGLLLFTQDAAAYIDPATGSILLQAIIGGFLALLVTLKMYWGRIRSFFGRGGSHSRTGEPGGDDR